MMLSQSFISSFLFCYCLLCQSIRVWSTNIRENKDTACKHLEVIYEESEVPAENIWAQNPARFSVEQGTLNEQS